MNERRSLARPVSTSSLSVEPGLLNAAQGAVMSDEETKPDPAKIIEAFKALCAALEPLDRASRERAIRATCIVLEIDLTARK